ncbi:MAG: hypothetical protein COA79_19200 [Planctomycetota bacterium]|nr:MAG: hypothetical protein COA79_19200 [Planctomycetota bacterium]
MDKDIEQINLLAIFHYVVGGMGIFFSCFPLIHMTVGILMITSDDLFTNKSNQRPPPEFMGYFFAFIGGLFFLIGQAISISIIYSGRCLHKKKKYMFSFVLACIACTFAPFGTILGIFTIIVLSRDSTKKLYSVN